MNASQYDDSIFGQMIIPKPTTQKMNIPKIVSNPITTSSYSQVNYSNSSYESGKYKKKYKGYCLLQKQNPWKALSSSYQNSSKSQILDNKNTMENCSSTIQQTRQNACTKNIPTPYDTQLHNRHKQIEQISKNKLSKSDNFYCACSEISEQSKMLGKKCVACGSVGFVDGTANMVKFMEYVMQFKLGIKQSYISNSIIQNNPLFKQNKQKLKQQTKQQYLQGYNMQELQQNRIIQTQNQQKQKKVKKVTLSNKPTILNKKSNQGNKVNQFCTDFIINQQNTSCKVQQNNIPIQTPYMQSKVFINNVSGMSENESYMSKKFGKNTMSDSQENVNHSMSKYGKMSQQINVSGIHLGINAMSLSVVDFQPTSNDSYTGSPDRSQEFNEKIQLQGNYELRQFSNQQQQQIPQQKINYNKKKPAKPTDLDKQSTKSIQNQIKSQQKITFQQQKTKSMVLNFQKSSNYGAQAQAQNPRQSLPAQRFMDFNEYKTKLSLQNTIHSGYSCNNCSVNPIVGLRYHCRSFLCDDDYDLCQKCYRDVGHKHCMQQIKVNQDIQKICQGLEQFTNKSISSTTRLSLGLLQKAQKPQQKNKYYGSMLDENMYNYQQVVGRSDNIMMNKGVFKSSIH